MEDFYCYMPTNPEDTKLELYKRELVDKSPKLISIDAETISVEDRTPLGIGISIDPHHSFYFPCYPNQNLFIPWRLLQDPSVKKLYHNAMFDLDVTDIISKDYGIGEIDKENIVDTAIMARLLCRDDAHLKWLAWESGRETESAEDIMKRYNTKNMLGVPEKDVALHCCQDTQVTYGLYLRWKDKVSPSILSIEMQVMPILLRMSNRGVKIDREVLAQLVKKYSEEVEFLHGLAEAEGFNPGSSQQVGYVLAKKGVFLPFTKPKKGTPRDRRKLNLATSKEILEFVDDPLAGLVIRYRHAASMLNTYLSPLVGKDRAYTHYHLDAITRRISSRDINMQNIPVGEMRSWCIPDNGVFVDFDYSQIELRILAFLSKDPDMKRIYELGLDIHQETADFMRIPRKLAKNVNFCVPLTTKALTPDGWKTYDKLIPGELVLGYSPDLESYQWTEVVTVMQPTISDIIRFGNSHTNFESTSSHRWYGKRRVHYHNHIKHPDYFTNEVRILSDINSEFIITLSSHLGSLQINDVPLSDVTPQEASIIAWLLTDGTWTTERADIFQTKPHNQDEIRRLLTGVPHTEHPQRFDGLIRWHIRQDWARSLRVKAKIDCIGLERFVLTLTPASRRAFVQSCLDAEGSFQYTWKFTQNVGEVLDAFQLASTLEGNFSKILDHSTAEYPKGRVVKLLKPYITCQRLGYIDVRKDYVWCMQTGIGSWVAKDDSNQIFITGNGMIYGATPQTLKETAKINDIKKCQDLIHGWFGKYRGAELWIREQQKYGQKHGYVDTIFGAKVRLPIELGEEEVNRRSTNYSIQCSAAEILKRAMIMCKNLPIAMQVYDQLVMDGMVELPQGLETIAEFPTPITVKEIERWE